MTNLVTQILPAHPHDFFTAEMITGIVTVLGLFITSAFAYLAKKTAAETQKAVNGRMEEFKILTEALSHAKGLAEGRKEEKAEAANSIANKAKGAAEERGRT